MKVEAMDTENTCPEEVVVHRKSGTMLPPCRVCADKASGFHYGVNSCEACKVFFRRSQKREIPSRCIKGDGKCLILPGKRLTCSFCRMKKCRAVGMSKESIRRGRYTLETRTNCIKEVKSLQVALQDTSSAIKTEADMIEETLNVILPADAEDMASPLSTSSSYAEKLETITDSLTQANIKFNVFSPEIVCNIPKLEQEFKEQKSQLESVFGRMRSLAPDEYQEVFQSTGIDIDGRRQMILYHLKRLEGRIRLFVNFAKNLPGWSSFPMDDQIALMKSSVYEWWVLCNYHAVNQEASLFTCSCGVTMDMEELQKMFQHNFIDEMFRSAAVLQRLALDQQEIALIKGITILSTDGCSSLRGASDIDESQTRLLEALQHHVRKNKPKEKHRFAKLLTSLAEVRRTAHEQERSAENLFQRWPDLQYPPMLMELLTG